MPRDFHEDLERDVVLLDASMRGGTQALRIAAGQFFEFVGEEDRVEEYLDWLTDVERAEYRLRVTRRWNEKRMARSSS